MQHRAVNSPDPINPDIPSSEWRNPSSPLLDALSQQPHEIQAPALLPLHFQVLFVSLYLPWQHREALPGKDKPLLGSLGGSSRPRLALPAPGTASSLLFWEQGAAEPCSEQEADGAGVQCAPAAPFVWLRKEGQAVEQPRAHTQG